MKLRAVDGMSSAAVKKVILLFIATGYFISILSTAYPVAFFAPELRERVSRVYSAVGLPQGWCMFAVTKKGYSYLRVEGVRSDGSVDEICVVPESSVDLFSINRQYWRTLFRLGGSEKPGSRYRSIAGYLMRKPQYNEYVTISFQRVEWPEHDHLFEDYRLGRGKRAKRLQYSDEESYTRGEIE